MRVRLALGLVFSLALTGCSLSPTAAPTAENGSSIQGIVHGGQQVISGAHVYLYAAATSGYESNASPIKSVSLLNSNVVTNNPGFYGQDTNNNYYVVTDSNGDFNITGDYTCTSGQQVYLYATGGNSGGGTNSDIGLMAILGNCSGSSFATAIPIVIMNEITTIAAAYAMAGFALDATHVSSSGTALAQIGVKNAFANAANLATISTGGSVGTTLGGNGTAPNSEVNTLANILAACINSNGSGFTTCGTLFSNALPGSIGSTATDTATAAINLAHNPYPGATQIANLCGLQVANTPFSPELPCNNTSPNTYPNDFTIALNFTGGGLDYPRGPAIDGSGNVWLANYFNNNVTELSSTGAAISPSTGYTGGGLDEAAGIAIDGSGYVWVTNWNNSVSKFTSAGVAVSPSTGYTGGGLDEAQAIAIDASGNAWIANLPNNSVSEFNNAGTPISPSAGYTGGGMAWPEGIAIDETGNIWVVNNENNSVTKLKGSDGSVISGSSGYSGGGLDYPEGISLDGSGNAWVANIDNNSVSKFTSAGAAVSGSSGYTGGGLDEAGEIAIDGSGNVWATSVQYARVSEFSNVGAAISPSTGYTASGMVTPVNLAIDGSGNVWVANDDNSSVTEFIGAATPVVTPIVANLISPYSAPASRP